MTTLCLYRKGVERDKFERALLWLQRNIEQIVQTVGLEYKRNKHFLHNINEIFLNQLCPTMEI